MRVVEGCVEMTCCQGTCDGLRKMVVCDVVTYRWSKRRVPH